MGWGFGASARGTLPSARAGPPGTRRSGGCPTPDYLRRMRGGRGRAQSRAPCIGRALDGGAQRMFAEAPPSVDGLARSDQSRNRPDGVAAALRGIGTGEMQPLWERLGELTMPVTIVVGERDLKFHSPGRRMAELFPQAT